MKLHLLLILISVFSLTAFAQARPPGNIQLLDGYVHKRLQGIDTQVGEISKRNGMNISYDIGEPAGNYAEGSFKDGKCAWYKKQKVNGLVLQLCLEKNGYINATFPAQYASFMAQTKSAEDIADF